MNDFSKVRTAAELEQKYNLSKFAGVVNNVEMNSNEIVKVQTQVNNMLRTLIINLGDTLQESVSLWFYNGTPTTSNEPYTDWVTPSDHYGDFYYDQGSGYVYEYTSNGWERNYDENLISALALTNAELDVSVDHERKVYLSQPTPPYSSGDWWILDDGTLKICQIGKLSGDYEEVDFVVSTMYTTTVASKENDTLTVLKGTVTQITEDYVKFTDLSTGGSSTIAGDNITTGTIKGINIQSTNYVANTTGMKIDLANGTINSKNLKLDSSGNLDVNGYITTAKGIMTNLQYNAGGVSNDFGSFYTLGYFWDGMTPMTFEYADLFIEGYIPANFEVTSASITVVHTVCENSDFNNTAHKGYAHDIRVYKLPTNTNNTWKLAYGNLTYTAIPNSQTGSALAVLGDPSNKTTLGKREVMTATLPISSFPAGSDFLLIVRGRDSSNSFPTTYEQYCERTGLAHAVLNIIGYMKT